MRKRNRLWSFALAGALAISNLSGVVALPASSIVAMAADDTNYTVVKWTGLEKDAYYGGTVVNPSFELNTKLKDDETDSSENVLTDYEVVVAISKGDIEPSLANENGYKDALARGLLIDKTNGLTRDTTVLSKYSFPLTLSANEDTTYGFKVYKITKTRESSTTDVWSYKAEELSNPSDSATLANVKATQISEVKVTPKFGNIATTDVNGVKVTAEAALNVDRAATDKDKVLSFGVYNKEKTDGGVTTTFEAAYKTAIGNYETAEAAYEAEAKREGATEASIEDARQAKISAMAAIKTTLDGFAVSGETFKIELAEPTSTVSKWTQEATITTANAAVGNYVLFVSEKKGTSGYVDYTSEHTATLDFKVEAFETDTFTVGREKTKNPPALYDETQETEKLGAVTLGDEVQLAAILVKDGQTSWVTTDPSVTWSVDTADEGYIEVGSNTGLVKTLKPTTKRTADDGGKTVTVNATYTNGNVKTVKPYIISEIVANEVTFTTPDGKTTDESFNVVVGENTQLTAYVDGKAQSSDITWNVYKTSTDTVALDTGEATLGSDGIFKANEAGAYWVEATYTYEGYEQKSNRKVIVANAEAGQSFMIGTLTEDGKGVAVKVEDDVAKAKPVESLKVGQTVDLISQIGTAKYDANGNGGDPDTRVQLKSGVTWAVADGYDKYVALDVSNYSTTGKVKVTAIGANDKGAKIIATYTNTVEGVTTISKSEFVITAIEGYTVDVHTKEDKTATNVEIASGTTANLVAYVDEKPYDDKDESGETITGAQINWTPYKASEGSNLADGVTITSDSNHDGVATFTAPVGEYYVVATYTAYKNGDDVITFSNDEARFFVKVVENASDSFVIGTEDKNNGKVAVTVTGNTATVKPLEYLSVDDTVQLIAQIGTVEYSSGKEVTGTDEREVIKSNVTWKVADAYKEYVSVDPSTGLVTALADSEEKPVEITATYKVDGKSTDATFTIGKIIANEVKVKTSDGKESTAAVVLGKTQKFIAYVDKDSRSEGIEWAVYQAATSGSPLVESDKAEIDEKGNFTAYAEGTYYVEATYTKHNISNSPRFIVVASPAKFTISFKNGNTVNGTDMYAGDTLNLKATYGDEDITTDANVVWTTSDPSYATVSNGVVTVIKGDKNPGRTVDVTATYTIGKSAFESNAITIDAIADEFNIRNEVGKITELKRGTAAKPIYIRGAEVIVGKTLQLALFNGAERDTDTKVNWVTEDDQIADISSKGLVSAKKEGSAEIWAVDASTGKKLAEFEVDVIKATISVRGKDNRWTFVGVEGDGSFGEDAVFDLSSPMALSIGETVTLEGLFGGDVVNGTWKSLNNNLATVNSTSGLVTTKAEGLVKISFEYEDHKAIAIITISDKETTITNEQKYNAKDYSEDTIKVAVGASDQLVVVNGTTDVTSKYNFTTDNEAVAVVDDNGKVTGVKQGDAKITATAKDGSGDTAIINVSVLETLKVKTVTLNNSSLIVETGKTGTLVATVDPTGTTETLTWTSSDPSVATVDNGVVTAVAEGKVTITAQAGEVFTKAEITVVKSEEEIQEEKAKAEQAKQDALAAVTAAASAAVADPTDANIKALEDAITAAKNAGASDEDVKAAENQLNDALKGAKNNAEIAKEASDKKAADAETAKATAEQKAAAAEQKATTAEKKSEELQKKADAEFETLKKAKATNGYIVNTFKNGEATLVSIPAAKTKATMTLASKVTVNGKKYKVTRIANKALKNNKKIKTLTVPTSYKVIGSYAFGSKITKLTVKGSNVQVLNNALKSINKNAKVIAKNTYTRTQLKTFGKAKKTVTISKK